MSKLDEAFVKLESLESRVALLEEVSSDNSARVDEFVTRVRTLDERVEALESFFLPSETNTDSDAVVDDTVPANSSIDENDKTAENTTVS